MKKGKRELKPFEIQPLTSDMFANLSIEELEERLELQILHISEAQACYDCGGRCDGRCDGRVECGCHGHVSCDPNICGECLDLCGAECVTQCGAQCPSLCGLETCIVNEEFPM